MMDLPAPAAIREFEGPLDTEGLEQVRTNGEPVVFRGLITNWPAVEAARRGDTEIIRYLTSQNSSRAVSAIAAPPGAKGRFFYTDDLMGLNFVTAKGHLSRFLSDLLKASDMDDPPAMAVQSEDIASLIPHFSRENGLSILSDISPRIWIGNRIKVAPHYDAKENIACCVAGCRSFTLFPPERTGDLYPGPFELTPAGTPVSMVDLESPDLERFPRFASAWQDARQATLAPGDAIYIPYGWWHGVQSLDPVSILVNYWWKPSQPEGVGSPYGGLLHAMLAFRHLPPDQRAFWKTILDFYVFESHGDPGKHLPDHAKGILGPPSPSLFGQLRSIIRRALDKPA